ncbi:MAG: hypothetical protein ACOYMA_20285 [Bacteroidia bacterium]
MYHEGEDILKNNSLAAYWIEKAYNVVFEEAKNFGEKMNYVNKKTFLLKGINKYYFMSDNK